MKRLTSEFIAQGVGMVANFTIGSTIGIGATVIASRFISPAVRTLVWLALFSSTVPLSVKISEVTTAEVQSMLEPLVEDDEEIEEGDLMKELDKIFKTA